MTRAAPWDMILAGVGAEKLDAIEAEARTHGVEPVAPETVMQLQSAGTAVHDLVGGAAGTAVREYGALIFHVLRFRREGGRVYALEPAVLRALAGKRPPVGAWPLEPPAAAGYARLPERLLWARVAPDAVPEPVDGFFWSTAQDAEGRRLDLLACLGLWPGRPGFSVVPVGAHAPEAGHWGDVQARAEGADFANILPGGELDDLLAVTTPLELLKLAARLFEHIARNPAAVAAEADGTFRVRSEPGDG